MQVSFQADNGTKTVLAVNVVALLLAIATSIWNVATMSQRIEALENRYKIIDRSVDGALGEQSDQAERITHLESVQASLVDDLNRLESFHFGEGASLGMARDIDTWSAGGRRLQLAPAEQEDRRDRPDAEGEREALRERGPRREGR